MNPLDASNWIPRSCCGAWPSWLWWYYVGSHVAIMALYVLWPGLLLTVLARIRAAGSVMVRIDGRDPIIAVVLSSGAFVAMCGLGHLLEGVVSFWWPNYFVFATWHWATAVVSAFAFRRLALLARLNKSRPP